jgi:hypothetical protein
MSTLTFIVTETPDPKLATVGARLTLEDAAQLLELNAQEMFTQAFLAAELRYFGFRFRIKRNPPFHPDEPARLPVRGRDVLPSGARIIACPQARATGRCKTVKHTVDFHVLG